MKRILLTGANGFIGKNFIDILSKKYKIIKITRESEIDILNLESLLKIDYIDVVIHCAAKTFVPDSFDNPYEFYEFNMQSTLNIAEFCRLKKVSKVIYLNSYPYGNPKYLPIDEYHSISFHSPYNKSKYLAETLLFQYLENISDVISLRIFNIYGKYQGKNFLIPTILDQIKVHENIKVKDLEPKRDYLYIKDLITLLNKIITKDNVSGIYNVGSSQSYSVEEVINQIKGIINSSISVDSENKRRENEVMDCFANITKLEKEIEWSPEYNLYEGLKDYLYEEKYV